MKPFNSFVEWAKANAHPVSSASEDNAEELSFLKSALADARVVSLGDFSITRAFLTPFILNCSGISWKI